MKIIKEVGIPLLNMPYSNSSYMGQGSDALKIHAVSYPLPESLCYDHDNYFHTL